MTVREIGSAEEFESILQGNPNTLIVVDFTATWCGPCQMMKPHFHRLAEENSKIIFVSVDVDDLDELASERGVTAMPTFQFYKNNVKVFEMRGAQLDGLKTALAQHQ